MIQLFLNNRLLHVASNTTVKLTVENPWFTSADSYTYEVELPLAIKSNRDFFGHIDRIDVKKTVSSYDCRLVTDNRTLLEGKAIVTTVTNEAVKVQLLGASGFYNFITKSEELYIDELELGGTVLSPVGFADVSAADNLYNGKAEYYYYPVENNSQGFICNNYCMIIPHSLASNSDLFYHVVGNTDAWMTLGKALYVPEYLRMSNISAQPTLWLMVERIAAATGLPLSREDNVFFNDSFLHRLFIASAEGSNKFCNKLPHWTVGEFWKEVEKTFGVVAQAKADGSGMQLIARETYYKEAESIEISQVLDEFTSEVDSDEQADVSSENTGFADHDSSPVNILEEEVLNVAKIDDTFADAEDIARAAHSSGDATAWLDARVNVLFSCANGRQYIYARNKFEHPALVEVNQFRPRIVDREKDSVAVELKFVPCKLIDYELPVVEYLTKDKLTGFHEVATVPIKILSRPDRDMKPSLSSTSWDVPPLEDMIFEEEEAEDIQAEEPEDVIYLGVSYEKDTSISVKSETFQNTWLTSRCPIPAGAEQHTVFITAGISGENGPGYSLALNEVEGQTNLYSKGMATELKIDTTIRNCFQFVSENLPDPTKIFLIRNKRFLCEKIEADILPEGMSKVLTGYFYEIR